MEKDMMKKQFGLPPMPPIGPGAPKRRSLQRQRDFSPLDWHEYFDTKFDVDTGDGDIFNVYSKGTEGPVLLFLHGGGFSALSWALLSTELTSLVQCTCVAMDQRGHGDTKTTDDSNLHAEQLSNDVGKVVSHLYPNEMPPIILVGHSMGGAIAVHVADRKLIPSLVGLAVIDVVEGTAMDALSSMQSFLRNRPKTFDSQQKAIEWAVKSGQFQNLASVRISMSGQLKIVSSVEELQSTESLTGRFTDVIQEEEESEEGESSNSRSSSSSPTISRSSSASDEKNSDASCSKQYTWRIDLSKTEKYWTGWFSGLSEKFLSCSPAKILILAGHDRLDKALTIGQMQGKFQMNLLPQCGHAVHEDVPDKVAEILAGFMVRQKVAEAVGSFHRPVPGC